MKTSALAFSAAIFLLSCTQSPNTNITIEKVDSSAATVQQDSLAVPVEKEENATVPAAKKSTTSDQAIHSNSSESTSETLTSSTGNEAKKKKGLSKTAKGAIIGGVVGAGTGAAVSKKNRLKGAALGGVIGAGAGALIGHDMDKKDGRH